MKTNPWLLKATLVALFFTAPFALASNFHVPADWYQLPERQGSYPSHSAATGASEETFSAALDDLLGVNH